MNVQFLTLKNFQFIIVFILNNKLAFILDYFISFHNNI